MLVSFAQNGYLKKTDFELTNFKLTKIIPEISTLRSTFNIFTVITKFNMIFEVSSTQSRIKSFDSKLSYP